MDNYNILEGQPRQQQQQEAEYYPPQVNTFNEKADLLDKIKPEAIVETIRNRLMGRALVNGVWTDIPAMKGHALTERGAWDLANLMLSVSSQNVALSNLDEKIINNRTREICRTAQYLMLSNWKAYGIKSEDQLDFVHQIIMSNTLITLKQPEREGIRKLLMGTIQENRSSISHDQQQKEGGMLRNLFSPKKF